MITIHNFDRGVRGQRVAWQCEEMGLDWRGEVFGYPPPAAYRAKYPPGSVPFLEDEGGVGMGESVAMMLYLAQRYGPTPLLPAASAAMARTLQLVVFSEAVLGGLMNPLMGTKFVAPADEKSNWTQAFCEARVSDGLGYAVSLLGEAAYFVGDDLTLADIAVSTTLGMWQGALGHDIPAPLAAHRDRMMARPAYERAAAKLSAP
ncbi:MAG: glutathione S-transferase family protein [Alphaproteobacteria bacterium]|nr:glutathione S-transferase family protein [Alphaproteobacteria bacterium]MBU1513475.1 glutathione S-transferase family protein [Alphaproteobacteria bacterium]MBU2096467.1 glutathione S-transferase family protein [Alphaproteobacteria bacterium]MBU2149841.1 glutathione S-transferase family protein [Alphaproteobacteria bacterium]MBU2308253.1 glutathione S-transferase family protein [Alphaproteobacteria bacterium]